MTFGQTWADPGDGFPASSSLNDFDFSFDPALIDSLPDSIPDFFLVAPRNTANDLQDQQQQQQLESLTLDPPPQSASSNLGPTSTGDSQHQSRASSPKSDSSPGRPGGESSRSGAGRANSKRDAEDPEVVVKRQRNTIAARKYRQKRLDRIQELEDALKAMTGERDDLRLRLARQEAETKALREMMQMKSGKGSDG